MLPSAHRATGYGIAIGCNRIMGLISAFVATYANTATSAPIFLCAALYIAMVSVDGAPELQEHSLTSRRPLLQS